MMEHLSGLGRKVGFFRPVIRTEENDYTIRLIASCYDLEFPYQEMYGCTYETARKMIRSGRQNDLMSLILEKYKAIESKSDFVLCSGTDFTGVATAFEFDFNAEVANNLGSLVIPLVKGYNKNLQQIESSVQSILNSLEEKGCNILSIIINRIDSSLINSIKAKLQSVITADIPLFFLPDHPLLGKPTVGEIARALNAKWISMGEGGPDREVKDYKVAAMELPHFLDYVRDGALIITPGDRSDIILGALISDASKSYPRIAGLLLSGGLTPAPQIQRLIDGLITSPVPILSLPEDTFTVAMNVNLVEGYIIPQNKRKIAAALGVMEDGVDFGELEKRISLPHPTRITPVVFEYELVRRAKSGRKHIVLPEGIDDRILRACEILLLRGVVDITLLGKLDQVKQKADSLGLSMMDVQVIDPVDSELRKSYARQYFELRRHKGVSEEMAYDVMADVSYFGTMMVYTGYVDGMVSGAAHTTQHTIRPAFEIIRAKPGVSIISSVFFMCMPDRVLVFGDCAVNPKPDAKELADIAVSSAETAMMFGVEPRIAMLSYSTGKSGKGEEVDRVSQAVEIARGMRPDLKIEGPIQYDAAIDPDVARSKMPGSEVAGRATVLIFPDLNTGNNTYKAVQRSAKAVAIGPVLQGLNKPVNDLSRGCSVPDIVNTVAITAIQAQQVRVDGK